MSPRNPLTGSGVRAAMPTLRLLNLCLVLGFTAACARLWPSLPDQLPRHMDLSGRVTSSAPTSPWSWFLLPAMAALTLELTEWMGTRVVRRPALINFPGKEDLLALPAAYQAPVVERLVGFLHGTTTVTTGILALVQFAAWQAATGTQTETSQLVLLLALCGLPLVLVGVGLTMVQRELERQRQAYRESEGRHR